MSILEKPSVLLGLAVVGFLLYKLLRGSSTYDALPWVARKNEWFSKARAGLRGSWYQQHYLEEGYQLYTKNGQAFVLPNFFIGHRIILPNDCMAELLAAPDEVLNVHDAQMEVTGLDFTIADPHVLTHELHVDIIKRQMTRALGDLIPDLIEELEIAFDKHWGTSTEWKEVSLYDTLVEVVAQVSNRIFLGAPACRNQTYLSACVAYAQDIIIAGTMVRVFPKSVKPYVGKIFGLLPEYHHRLATRYALPLIKQRIAEFEAGETPHEDFLQWLVESGPKGHVKDSTPEMMARRISIVNFAAIHTTTLTIANCLCLMLDSPDCSEIQQELKEEVEEVTESSGGIWTKATIAKMLKADSLIRETQRLRGPTWSLERYVLPAEGYTFKNGVHIPQGCRASFNGWAIQRDPRKYGANAAEFDPFRFSAERETIDSKTEKEDLSGYIKQRNLALVALSEDHLPFGLGKHACPGRFFASQELKLLIRHLVTKYEFKPIDGHKVDPPLLMLGGVLPALGRKMLVRRRAV